MSKRTFKHMSSRSLIILTLTILCVGQIDAAPEMAPSIIGTRVLDLDGKVHRIGFGEELQKVAIVFLDTGCPIARRYAPYLNKIHKFAAEKNITLYGVLSDPLTTPADGRKFREQYSMIGSWWYAIRDALGI